MNLCQIESKSSLASIILLVIKPLLRTRVGQSSLTTPVYGRFFPPFILVQFITEVQNNGTGMFAGYEDKKSSWSQEQYAH